MAWSWSHTTEAYERVRQQIFDAPREWLEVVFAEWEAENKKENEGFSEKKYEKALKRAKKMEEEALAGYIWEKAEEQSLCSNGGYLAYCCPFQCLPHSLPF